MNTFKEYPATHSMSTAWYCADEDGNIAVFDIDDNGPVPEEYTGSDLCVEDMLWDIFTIKEKDGIRYLNLTDDQISRLLIHPDNTKGEWEKDTYSWYNPAWLDIIIQINMSKLDILKQAVNQPKENHYIVCLSKEKGLFMVDLFSNKSGVELLEKNNVVLAKYKLPMYRNPDYDADDEYSSDRDKYPFFIYHQDYDTTKYPAEKIATPQFPMKVAQLPEALQKIITHLPLKFADTDAIQLAEHMQVGVNGYEEYVYNDLIWKRIMSSRYKPIYYNWLTNAIISEDEMMDFLDEGKAEQFDYDKHQYLLKKQRD